MWRGISLFKSLQGRLPATHSLRVMGQGYSGVRMTGELCDKAHLHTLGLQCAYERMTGAVRRHIRKAEREEGWAPICIAEVDIGERAAPFLMMPRFEFTEPREKASNTIALRASELPAQEHGSKQRRDGYVARARHRLRQIGDGTVDFLHASNVEDTPGKVHVVPQQRQLLAGTHAGQEGEGVIDALVVVGQSRV